MFNIVGRTFCRSLKELSLLLAGVTMALLVGPALPAKDNNELGRVVGYDKKGIKGDAEIKRVCHDATDFNYQNWPGIAEQESGRHPYYLSMSPEPADRFEGIQKQLESFNSYRIDKILPADVSKYLGSLDPNGKNFDGELNKTFRDKVTELSTRKGGEQGQLEMLRNWSNWGCFPDLTSDCKKAFREIVDIQRPFEVSISLFRATKEEKENSDTLRFVTSAAPLIAEVGTDPIYRKAAIILAKNLNKKVADLKSNPAGSPPGDLYEDTMAAFLAAGASPTDAKTYSINFLGLYGTRGSAPDPFYMFSNQNNKDTFVCLGLVTSMISYLDSKSYGSGKLYSIPPEITTSCDYTRPYHFWMSTYLVRELKKKGFSDKDSLNAIHSMGKLYEMYADVSTNSKTRRVNFDKTGNYYNVETQKDIIFNDLGSAWAIRNSGENSAATLNGDVVFKTTLSEVKEKANKLKRLALKLVPGLKDAIKNMNLDYDSAINWEARIAPEAHMTQVTGFANIK